MRLTLLPLLAQDALFVGGALAGRQKPLRVWGPSGATPERGTKYAIEHLRKALTWDIDGPVSFIVEWNGFKFVFGGDTYPNKWFAKYATGADLAIHECFISVPDMIDKFKFTPQSALAVGTQIHTSPEAFGKMMSIIKPRMAVAYHFFKDFDTTGAIFDGVRTTYDGPLSLSEDYMLWNITKDDIRVRMAAIDEDVWPPPGQKPSEIKT
jgi:ribonuclease Z